MYSLLILVLMDVRGSSNLIVIPMQRTASFLVFQVYGLFLQGQEDQAAYFLNLRDSYIEWGD